MPAPVTATVCAKVRAYGGSVQNALATLPTVRRVIRLHVRVTAGYADIETLRRAVTEFEADLISEDYAENVTYEVAVPEDAADRFISAIVDRTAGRAIVDDKTE